jgi:UPF0042 nucleotide-binding protein
MTSNAQQGATSDPASSGSSHSRGMPHLVVVTGLSGAGRSTALHVLEDVGFYCVDNLPPALAPELVRRVSEGSAKAGSLRIGLGIDVRTGSFLEDSTRVLDEFERDGYQVDILFLDATDEQLIRRFSETRRPHPLAAMGDVEAAIQQERGLLSGLRGRARYVLDTSRLTVHDLRRSLIEYIAHGGAKPALLLRLVSFGFKYGLPNDADLVFDVRFLPNPHFVPALRALTGIDEQVARYVFQSSDAQQYTRELGDFILRWLPKYEQEGKAYLTVAIGCTGGKHRSVAITEKLAESLGAYKHAVVFHRDSKR